MVCFGRYAIAIIHNQSGQPLTEDNIKRVLACHNHNVMKFDIMLDTIDATETKYGTVITAEINNRDGGLEHATTPITSVVFNVWDDTGSASFMY